MKADRITGARAWRAVMNHLLLQQLAGVRLSAWQRFLFWLALKLPFAVIVTRDGTCRPYLLRAVLVPRTRWLPPLWLHYFFRGDDEAALHNHPWGALALILSGGYVEERWRSGRREWQVRRPGDVVLLRRNTHHRVSLYRGGSWSLFVPGKRTTAPRHLAWGFWVPETDERWFHSERRDA